MVSRPDILFLVLDTQRADRLSCYGYDQPTSPHIDALAAEATRFTQAISAAQWTVPSHASMFTGLYPRSTPWCSPTRCCRPTCPLWPSD